VSRGTRLADARVEVIAPRYVDVVWRRGLRRVEGKGGGGGDARRMVERVRGEGILKEEKAVRRVERSR
jgi:hypothetical protein